MDCFIFTPSDGNNKLEKKKKKKQFISTSHFDRIWCSEIKHKWRHLPLDEIFRIDKIDLKRNVFVIDKDDNKFYIEYSSIPITVFQDMRKCLTINLLKDVYFRKCVGGVYQIICK